MTRYKTQAIERAVAAYLRWHESKGTTPEHPDSSESDQVNDVIFLRAGGREITRYRVRPDRRLRKLKTIADHVSLLTGGDGA